MGGCWWWWYGWNDNRMSSREYTSTQLQEQWGQNGRMTSRSHMEIWVSFDGLRRKAPSYLVDGSACESTTTTDHPPMGCDKEQCCWWGGGHDKVDAAEPVMTDSDSRLNLCAMCGWCSSVSVAVGKYNLQNINTFILLLLHLSLPPLPHINTIHVFLAGDRVTDDDWLSSSPSGGLQRWRWRDGSSSVYVRPSRVHIHNVGSGQTTGTRQGLWRSLVTGCQWVCHRHRFPCSYLPIVLNRGSSHDSGKYLLSNAFPGNPRAASAVDVVVVSIQPQKNIMWACRWPGGGYVLTWAVTDCQDHAYAVLCSASTGSSLIVRGQRRAVAEKVQLLDEELSARANKQGLCRKVCYGTSFEESIKWKMLQKWRHWNSHGE